MTDIARGADLPDTGELRSRIERLIQDRETLLRELEPRALPTVDPVAYQTAASHRVVIRQLTAALGRIDAGRYGWCERCGRRIAAARLEALPHASACIASQSHADAA